MEKYEFIDKILQDLDIFYEDMVAYVDTSSAKSVAEKSILERKIAVREDIIRRAFPECPSSLQS